MDKTRSEYLDLAKARALKLLDSGELVLAMASMAHDLKRKTPQLFPSPYVASRVVKAHELVLAKDADALRQWIEDFA